MLQSCQTCGVTISEWSYWCPSINNIKQCFIINNDRYIASNVSLIFQYINRMNQEQIERLKKTKIKGQSRSFTCFLIYYVVKALVVLILYKYDNYLKHQSAYLVVFVVLLVVNNYLMLSTGTDPGYQTSHFQENQLLAFQRNQVNFCTICNSRKRNRAKHCFYCGKCVRKFDHHCPWIGACVGENNHFKFCILLLAHTLQATNTFYICFKSLDLFEYRFKDGHFSPQYGVFAVFSIFMIFYMFFAGGLLCFHVYLVACNITSNQLLARRKCWYLNGVKGNPFSEGIIKNFIMAATKQENGREWIIQQKQPKQKTCFDKIWQNDYYECC